MMTFDEAFGMFVYGFLGFIAMPFAAYYQYYENPNGELWQVVVALCMMPVCIYMFFRIVKERQQ